MSTLAYHRGPRPAPPAVPGDAVTVRTPPPLEDSSTLLRTLQIVAPVAAAGTGLVFILGYRQQGSLLLVAMGAAIGVGVAVALLTAVVQARLSGRRRRRARERYLAYLAGMQQRLDSILTKQREREAELFPSCAELLRRATERQRLFERRPTDSDFLDVRIGTGRLPAPLGVVLQDVDPLGPDLDSELLAAARELVGRYAMRDSGPRTLALRGGGTIVLRGNAPATRGIARAAVIQAAVLHSPDELRIALVADTATVDAQWDWIKWLPHARNDRHGTRVHCATDAASANAMLRDVIGPANQPGAAHALVVADGWTPGADVAESSALRAAMSAASASPVTVVCLVASDDEPAELHQRVVVEQPDAARLEDGGGRTDGLAFRAETLSAADAEAVARLLAPLRPPGTAASDAGATPAGLAAAMGLESFGALDVEQTWRAAATSLLRAPMGLTPDGRPLVLDLKEFAQGGMGPHGMLIGAPGAGKSELLRTLVAALAASHPPRLLAFVLVDFKGGAAFQPLARLPHVAGIVTNLEDDRSMVERFRLAVEGEVTRRQTIFRAAGNVPDIRTYQWRQARDPALEPLPCLWLVVDEFAELLANYPDFDAFFEGVARLGRALGIHLLLATQGVSSGLSRLDRYLSYRIAMRTNSVAESMAVLGSNAAARLPLVPGLGFLKVGQGSPEAFTAFHVSGPRRRHGGRDAVVAPVRVFRAAPAVAGERARVPGEGDPGDTPCAELDDIVDSVLEAGAERAHPVWLTPLPRVLPLDTVLSGDVDSLRVTLGLADFPWEQRQEPWGMDFAGQHGHLAVVGAPRTGRSTALRTVVASFVLTHRPEDVQFYVIDMGGALRALAAAPHVGAVAAKAEPELARRMLRHLRRGIDERDATLRRLGLGSIAELRAQRRGGGPGGDLADLFLVVDNWGAATNAFDWLEDEVTALAGVGLAYGVHLVLSADRWADVRPRLRDRIPGRIQLRPLEAGDSILDARATRALTNTPGRALVPSGQQVQLALPRVDGVADVAGVEPAFRDLVERHAVTGRPAPRLQLLPDTVRLDDVPWEQPRTSTATPIGIDDADLQPVALDLFSRDVQHVLVAGDSRCGKTSFLRAYLTALTRVCTPAQLRLHIVDVRRGLLDAVPDAYVAAHALTSADVVTLVSDLRAALSARVAPAGASRRELADRSHITGPELVLVVDDDDIVESFSLRPLTASIAVAWDMKFHVVLARRPTGVDFDGLASALVSNGATCVEMSESSRSLVRSRPVTLPPGRAHLIERGGAPTLLQLIHDTTGEAAADAGPAAAEGVRVLQGTVRTA